MLQIIKKLVFSEDSNEGIKNFLVSADFPKLIPGDVHEAILKATYDIDLIKISDFEIKD